MERVGVFYATREGQARKVAERITSVLASRGLTASLHGVLEADAGSALEKSEAAVLVGSVHIGKHEKELVTFTRAHRPKLDAVPAAFVSVCSAEGAVENLASSPEVRTKAAAAVAQQLAEFTTATGWHPAHVRPVAGALVYTHYNPLVRWIMKQIARSEQLPTDTTRDHEMTDWLSVDDFARQLADQMLAA